MKSLKTFLAVITLGMLSVGSAWADHGHGGYDHHDRVHFGVSIGAWAPWYYPPAYYYPPTYYYPQPQVIITQPPVYVEQAAPTPEPAAQAYYWYYCSASRTYYPYVKECPSGWQRVSPQPPSQP